MTNQEKLEAVNSLESRMGLPRDSLFDCMLVETGGSLSTSIKNSTSSATGLIQFMQSTALSLGTTTGLLAEMSFLEQLRFVELYFKPYLGVLHRSDDYLDIYCAILYPALIGKPETAVMSNSASRGNIGLDANKNGVVSKAEIRLFYDRTVKSWRQRLLLPPSVHSLFNWKKLFLPVAIACGLLALSK